MSPDGMAFTICHELGHHIGGAPFTTDYPWASVEGQSDYFAANICLKKFFADEDNQRLADDSKLHPHVVNRCDTQYSDLDQRAICKRTSRASYEFGQLMVYSSSDDRGRPRYKEIEMNKVYGTKVSSTMQIHPMPQCRFDTGFAGAQCPLNFILYYNKNDQVYDCRRIDGYARETRPRCWFKPNSSRVSKTFSAKSSCLKHRSDLN